MSAHEALEIAKTKGWLGEGQAYSIEALKASMLAKQNASLSKDDQPSVDKKGPRIQNRALKCNLGVYESTRVSYDESLITVHVRPVYLVSH